MNATRPYQPSNGTEGEWFADKWCGKCARDVPSSTGKDWDLCCEDELCKIIPLTMVYSVGDPEYPKEWVCDAEGYPGNPRCTAFVRVGARIPTIPASDDKTIDMFSTTQDAG